MTQLLISVTSVEEAQIALAHGADFIDLKDPSKGALGALPLSTIQEVVAFVHLYDIHGKRLTSATIGDLPMQPELIIDKVVTLAASKVDIIKIGFFEESDYQSCLDVLKVITKTGIKLIAVLFAEFKYPLGLIKSIKDAGFYGVMIDTAQKNGTTFLDYYSQDDMRNFVEQLQAQDLIFGLAGSLNIQHVAKVKLFNPGYIGFRGGVCVENQRKLSLDADKITAIRKML